MNLNRMRRDVMTLALLAPALALAELAAESFHWSRPLEGAPVAHTLVAAAPFDAALFAATAADFRDLRLLSADGVETPRAIRKVMNVRSRTIQHPVAAQLVALKELADNRIEVEFVLTKTNACADGFSVATPLRDFHHSVRVEGSSDGVVWTTLVTAAPLLDYTRYLELRQLDVKMPSNTCRHFRLTIGTVTSEQALPLTRLMRQTGGREGGVERRTVDLLQQTFRVDRVDFWRTASVDGAAEEVRTDWPLTAFKLERDVKEHTTLITLQTGRLPLNRLTLEFGENNFSRPLTLQTPTVRNGVAAWDDLASGRLCDIELAGFSRRDLALTFGEVRLERVRLVLHDGDNPPLTLKAITGSGPVYRTLFLAAPGAGYRLLYGNEKLPAPNYDLESVLTPVLRGLQPVEWKLGAPVENKAFRPAGTPLAWLNSSWTFGAVLALMLLVLGALLLRTARTAARQLNDRTPDGP